MRKPISKKIREQVYMKYDGHCAYCGCKLNYKDMQVDHIVSVYVDTLRNNKQNDSIDNLMPSCRMCNYYKQTDDIEGLRRKLQNILMPNVRRPFIYRLALRYGLVAENIQPIRFYFETYDNSRTEKE